MHCTNKHIRILYDYSGLSDFNNESYYINFDLVKKNAFSNYKLIFNFFSATI